MGGFNQITDHAVSLVKDKDSSLLTLTISGGLELFQKLLGEAEEKGMTCEIYKKVRKQLDSLVRLK